MSSLISAHRECLPVQCYFFCADYTFPHTLLPPLKPNHIIISCQLNSERVQQEKNNHDAKFKHNNLQLHLGHTSLRPLRNCFIPCLDGTVPL